MSGLVMRWGFIPFPLAIVDDARHRDLSLGEFRLLGYLLRHRFRVKAEVFDVSQDELLHGIYRHSGGRWDGGCGITSGRDLRKARAALEARGWLRVTERRDGSIVYELTLSEGDEEGETARAGVAVEAVSDSHVGAKCTRESGAKSTRNRDKMHPVSRQNAPADIEEKALEGIREEKPISPVTAEAVPASQQPACDAKGEEQRQRQPQGQRRGLELVRAQPEELRLVSPEIAAGRGKGDPRHQPCREAVAAYQRHKGVTPTWDGAAAGQLARLLESAPELTVGDFQRCLQHRARSEGVTHGALPRRWLARLLDFQDGPLDRFGKVSQGNGASRNDTQGYENRAQQRTDSNVANALAVLRDIASGTGGSSGSEAGWSLEGVDAGLSRAAG